MGEGRPGSSEVEAKQITRTQIQFIKVPDGHRREFRVKSSCETCLWLRYASSNIFVSFTRNSIGPSKALTPWNACDCEIWIIRLHPYPSVHWHPRISISGRFRLCRKINTWTLEHGIHCDIQRSARLSSISSASRYHLLCGRIVTESIAKIRLLSLETELLHLNYLTTLYFISSPILLSVF